jgi:hypothetical protein
MSVPEVEAIACGGHVSPRNCQETCQFAWLQVVRHVLGMSIEVSGASADSDSDDGDIGRDHRLWQLPLPSSSKS